MKNKFVVLWVSGVLSTIIALPYIFALQHEFIAQSPLSLFQISLISVGQSALLLAVAIFFGLKLSQKIELPTLVLFESKHYRNENIWRLLTTSLSLGTIVALIIKGLDFFFLKYIPDLVIVSQQIPFWKTILVPFYGGVVEELLMRLFLVSCIAWILSRFILSKPVIKNNFIMWSAIIIASIVFGLGHLPATATITALTPLVITRAILLNGIGGIVFGWLYWKKGLEFSILSHFTTDIVLIALLPLLF